MLNEEWVTSNDPCFDLICNNEQCIPQSTALVPKKERLDGKDCNKNDCHIDHGIDDKTSLKLK